MDTLLQEILEDLLKRLETPFRKIKIEEKEPGHFRVNIESEEPSLLIGHHGENITALQNVLKAILWKKEPDFQNVVLDVDDYRKRQEENVIKLAQRKAETLEKNSYPQSLPPMSAYFRRIVHLYLAEKFPHIVTESRGEGDLRHITLKLKGQETFVPNENEEDMSIL
jgi:spoIIIJ-associated protein